jgi:hypothetical protein
MATFSLFIILPSAFEMSLVTGLRAERYDPAGLGCYERSFLIIPMIGYG